MKLSPFKYGTSGAGQKKQRLLFLCFLRFVIFYRTFFFMMMTPAPNRISDVTPMMIGILLFLFSPVGGVTVTISPLSYKCDVIIFGMVPVPFVFFTSVISVSLFKSISSEFESIFLAVKVVLFFPPGFNSLFSSPFSSIVFASNFTVLTVLSSALSSYHSVSKFTILFSPLSHS